MASFTLEQLEQIWTFNGGPSNEAAIAAAIALAESGGCQYALAAPTDIRPVQECTYRDTSGEFSVGLWQINTYAHPQYDRMSLFDPAYNAEAAVAVSSGGTDFTPWSTFNNGAYLQYLTPGSTATPHPAGPPGSIFSPFPDEATPVLTGTVPAHVTRAWSHMIRQLGVTLPSAARAGRLVSRRMLPAVAIRRRQK